jgi:phosphoribosyl 1,2-cyclic phosphodiesterase
MGRVRVTILASGSGGNATLVQAGGTNVLVDAGIGPDVVRERMRIALGCEVGIDAILTTHAHGDHVGRVAPLARSFGARVYMTEATQRRIAALDARTIVYGHETPFDIGAVRVEPMAVPHDCPQVALVLQHARARCALVTDLGQAPKRMSKHFAGCQLVLMESNYDPDMLWRGPYPEFLKRRVASRLGHLSNEDSASFLAELGPETSDVVLMHVSRTNNAPELALRAARAALRGRKVRLQAASQDTPLDLTVRWSASVKARAHEAQLALDLG